MSERQLDAELRFHLEKQMAHYIAAGLSCEEARRRARRVELILAMRHE